MKTLHFLALACLSIHGKAALAQASEPSLDIGTRARITAPSVSPELFVGRVTARDSALLTLRRAITRDDVRIPIAAIERLELSKGHDRGGWAAMGFGVGLAGGFAIGGVMALSDQGSSGGANLAPVGGALLGMLVGPILGAIAAPERWHRVAVPPR